MKAIRHSLAVAAVAVATQFGALATAPQAHAAYVFTVSQVGADVVGTGSGSINTTALTDEGTAYLDNGYFAMGSREGSAGAAATVTFWSGISGPSGFGTSVYNPASSGTGDAVAIVANAGIYLAQTYESGAPLSSGAIWANHTISSLGLTPGDYVWTWGSGATADSYELIIGAPEPASLALIGLPVTGMLLLRRRRGVAVA